MKYRFSGHFREEYFGMVLYNIQGNLDFVDQETGVFVKALSTSPQEWSMLRDLCPPKLVEKFAEFLPWGIANGYVEILFDQGVPSTVYIPGIDIDIAPVDNRRRLSAPLTVTVIPEQRCNQKCFFCFAHDNMANKVDCLSTADWENIVGTCIDAKITRIVILGGEPLLNLPLLLRILDRAHQHIPVTLFTNGTALGGITEKAAYTNLDIVFSIHAKSDHIHDSIVGLNGAHRIAMQSLGAVRKANKNSISVNSVVTTKNIDEIIPFAIELDELGVDNYTFSPFAPWNATHDYTEYMISPAILLDKYNQISSHFKKSGSSMDITCDIPYATGAMAVEKKYSGEVISMHSRPCVGDANMIINANGDIYACNQIVGDEQYKLSNALTSPNIFECWSTYRWPHARCATWQGDHSCFYCEKRMVCHGGCPLISEGLLKEKERGNPYCIKVYENKGGGDKRGNASHIPTCGYT